MIEDRLKRLNLRVDVLFPKEEFPLGKVVSSINLVAYNYTLKRKSFFKLKTCFESK